MLKLFWLLLMFALSNALRSTMGRSMLTSLHGLRATTVSAASFQEVRESESEIIDLFTERGKENSTETQLVKLVSKSNYEAWMSSLPEGKLQVFKEVGVDLTKWPGCGKVFPLDNGMCALYDDHCDPSKLSFKTLWPAIMKSKKMYIQFVMHDGTEIPSGVANRLAYAWTTHNYKLSVFKKKKPKSEPKIRMIWPHNSNRNDILGLATSLRLFKNLVESPAMTVGPAELGEAVVSIAEEFGCTPKLYTGVEELCDNGFPQVAAVGMAAGQGREPRVVEFVWGEKEHREVVVIGKGITFDVGGLNIKGPSMKGMKRDMAGAAMALALSRLIMHSKLKCRLRTIIPIAENSINGEAMRPSDVIRSRTGKTTEITNTDAEGRLILADCLAAGCEEPLDALLGTDKRRIIVNFATLTGAARVALGSDLPALFSNDHAAMMELFRLSHSVEDSDKYDGIDPVWPMPLWEPMREALKSPIADLVNAPGTGGGAITAALYLSEFISPLTAPSSESTAYLAGKSGGESGEKDKRKGEEDEEDEEDEEEDTHARRNTEEKMAPIWFHLDFPGDKPAGMRAVYNFIKRSLT